MLLPGSTDLNHASGPVPPDAGAVDDGPGTASRREPMRRCIATGQVLPKAALIRFVVGPDGTLTPDIAGKLPGRGIWVAAERTALERAVRRGLFARAAAKARLGPIRVPDGLIGQVADLLRARCLDAVALARRGGQAVGGFDKVRSWLTSGRAAVLLAASDGAADGRAKLARLADGRPVIDAFDAAALGAAFGRDCVVHAALAPGGLAGRLVTEAVRFEGVSSCINEGQGRTCRGRDTLEAK